MNASSKVSVPRRDQRLIPKLHRLVQKVGRIKPKLKKVEQKLKRWGMRSAFQIQQWRIARAYARFDIETALKACPVQPMYSLVVPVYRTDLRWLNRCIESVRRQSYQRWELILVDDGSQKPELTAELLRWSRKDRRIRVFALPKNQGISVASNHGLAQAEGEFIGLLDHDDELTPDALMWMVVEHNLNPQARWFYSDEAVLEMDGNYAGRFHRKPAYSPEYLLSVMYICHFTVYERKLVEVVGGFRPEADGAQDHDLALRISDHVKRDEVVHIPQILYFWRAIPESTACNPGIKPAAAGAALRAVESAVARRGSPIQVTADSEIATLFHLELPLREFPKVAIVIPTRNATDMVERCIESLMANTNYLNYEIVVIDNQSDDPSLQKYLGSLSSRANARSILYDRPFNHSDMHNFAIPQIDAELIVLANNDVYDFSPGWLEQLVATTQLDSNIAGVGGKLFYPDGTIQHAGVVIGVGEGLAGNVGCGQPGNSPGYLGRARSLQDVSAVTGALMIIKKSAFLEVEGFDAERYPTSYNDVDLWMRLLALGYRCLFNPEVQALHEESKTRGVSANELEFQRRMREDVQQREFHDSFWNLALFDNPSRVRRSERTATWAIEKLGALKKKIAALGELHQSSTCFENAESDQLPKVKVLHRAA